MKKATTALLIVALAAVSWRERSSKMADRMDVWDDLARTIFEIGYRRSRRQDMERACLIFTQLGATWDLSRAKAALVATVDFPASEGNRQ